MILIDEKTGLKFSEEQAICCVHLIRLLGITLHHPETSGHAISIYLPRSVIEEMKEVIEEIDRENETH